jgi:hypothetical protein
MQPTEEDNQRLEENLDKPFLDFLKAQQLTTNVINFIVYSIVNEMTDQEKGIK